MSALTIDGIMAGGGGPRTTLSTPRLRLVTDAPARPIGRSRSVRGFQEAGNSRAVTAPPLGAPVRLVGEHRRDIIRPGGVRLTERGMLAVLVVFAVLALVSVVVIVASFFAVSNAPIDGPFAAPVAGAGVGS